MALWFTGMILGLFFVAFVTKICFMLSVGALIHRDWVASIIFAVISLLGAGSTVFVFVSIIARAVGVL